MYAKNLIIQAFLGQNINKMCKIYDFGVFFRTEKTPNEIIKKSLLMCIIASKARSYSATLAVARASI